MLGAADELTEQGIYVDAAVSRQMQTVIPEVEQLRDAGRLAARRWSCTSARTARSATTR